MLKKYCRTGHFGEQEIFANCVTLVRFRKNFVPMKISSLNDVAIYIECLPN